MLKNTSKLNDQNIEKHNPSRKPNTAKLKMLQARFDARPRRPSTD
jgi:hypothetical protein